MRILTWNVNVLRTCLDYHPFSSMEKRNVEGLLDTLGAEIACFQEHKTRRAQLERLYACPGPYDAFWTFPRSKTGYSGVCTFVDSRFCVPVKGEEGITGLLLDDKASTMKPPWRPEERIGHYPDHDEMHYQDEEGVAFDPRRLDMEGRAVVLDFGLFVLFNLYSPNETNETRRPYKMNFLACLQERVKLLMSAGKEVIIVGDLNIVRAPIDSGEGGIRTSAEQHYEHPARVILNDWIAPRGPMIDVVRESFPDRDDMFTCWNQKLDARPSNYGSRIDYILCSPGLRPWIKGGDINNKIFGSDHCPVYIDLHDSIEVPDISSEGSSDGARKTVYLRDLLNPPDRPPSTAPVYPQDPPRTAPEPPRFATKFYDEFSGKQRTLKSFFGGGSKASAKGEVMTRTKEGSWEMVKKSAIGQRPEGGAVAGLDGAAGPDDVAPSTTASTGEPHRVVPVAGRSTLEMPSTPFGIARAAFDNLDHPNELAGSLSSARINAAAGPSRSPSLPTSRRGDPSTADTPKPARTSVATEDDDDDVQFLPADAVRPGMPSRTSNGSGTVSQSTSISKAGPSTSNKRQKTTNGGGPTGQQSISSFFAAPKKPKAASITSDRPGSRDRSLSNTTSRTAADAAIEIDVADLPPPLSPVPSTNNARIAVQSETPDPEEDAAVAAALAAEEAEEEASREARKAEQAPIWNNLFAKKAAPLCTVHRKPCKVFTSKVVGPNKNKRFWLCSLPVGPGYDSGRSKRKREDVNPNFRCDFFLWDSANSKREPASAPSSTTPGRQ